MTVAMAVVIVVVVLVLVPAAMPTRVGVLPAFLHPALLHEVHRLTAGGVAAAVALPVTLMLHRHVQVHRPLVDGVRRRRDDDRLRVDHRWRRLIADVDAPVHARLADAERHADVGGREGRCCGRGGKDENGQSLHVDSFGAVERSTWVGVTPSARSALPLHRFTKIHPAPRQQPATNAINGHCGGVSACQPPPIAWIKATAVVWRSAAACTSARRALSAVACAVTTSL